MAAGVKAVGRFVAYAAIVSIIDLAGSRLHAATPEAFCVRPGAVGAVQDAIASAALTRAAESVEARLAQGNGPDRDGGNSRSALNVPLAPNASPAALALALYCDAAGEVERLALSGSVPQARAFLFSAFTYGETAQDPDVAARAAYRLGLLAVADTEQANVRGAGTQAPDTLAPAGIEAPKSSPAKDACDQLVSRRHSPSLALQCAVTRSAAAGDARLASLASLRLARLWLVAAEGVARTDMVAREYVRQLALRGPPTYETGPEGGEGRGQDPAVLRGRSANAALFGLNWVAGIGDPADRLELTGRLVEAVIDAGQPGAPALAHATGEMEAALPGDPGARAYAAALSGRIALAAGDRAGAKAFFQRAIFHENQRQQPTRLADWFLLMARAEPARRVEYAGDAYLALENVRALLPSRDPFTEESTFGLHMRAVFEAAADAELSQDARGERPEAVSRAQRIVEASREAEIQSNFGSECIPPTPPIKPSILRKGEIVLYPILLENRVELLYAVGGDDAFHRLPANTSINRDQIAALVERLRASAVHRDDLWRGPSRRLYDVLIAPIEGRLTAETTLVVIPDGPLRALPFASLIDGHGKFLIERTRLSIAPALSYAQPGLDRAGRGAIVVAATLEREVVLPVGTFPKLEETGDEAKAATGGAGAERQSILLENFTRASLTNALERSRPSVLHLATHAAFNGRSDRSYIVADGEAIPLADLRAMIAQRRARGDTLDLLVLSACETAVGDDQASMGLAGAAVQAGARSAIASIWKAEDDSTMALMTAFYAAYRGGATKSEALRAAQLAVLSQGYSEPFYWAAFTLIGGWR
ncbi:MAG TPA: CHAT domain-containing protein [Caulobacteraceae bacterium]